jgi:hypothetical protein
MSFWTSDLACGQHEQNNGGAARRGHHIIKAIVEFILLALPKANHLWCCTYVNNIKRDVDHHIHTQIHTRIEKYIWTAWQHLPTPPTLMETERNAQKTFIERILEYFSAFCQPFDKPAVCCDLLHMHIQPNRSCETLRKWWGHTALGISLVLHANMHVGVSSPSPPHCLRRTVQELWAAFKERLVASCYCSLHREQVMFGF